MNFKKCKVVAEACCNHQGDFNKAVKMIKISKLCGADYVKFQKRNPGKAVPIFMHSQPHPYSFHSFGETYLEHRKFLEFSINQHKQLKKICEESGINYSCSVWDEDSAREIISLDPNYIKVPSPMNENYKILKILFNEYDKDIHISLGMIDSKARKYLLDYLSDKKDRIVLYWTTSGYPVKFKELYLLEIKDLLLEFPRVGFSGHHLGIAVDMISYCLGVTWIERHFTLDRTLKGTDHSASLESMGLQKLCRDLKAAYDSLSYKNIELTEDEKNNDRKLKVKISL